MKPFVLLLAAASLMWADVAGNWKATAEGPNGTIERTFTFKVDGAKLTGETVSSFSGKSVINDGKVDGDNFSFTIVANIQGNEMKLAYKGKVTGDTIKLTSSFGDSGQTIEWSGKRTQ
jgi:hypothetical protein